MTNLQTAVDSMETLKDDLEALYDTSAQRLFVCALAVTGCRDSAEDAMHEAFCRLLKLNERPRDLVAYAMRSVRNAAIDQVRRRGRTVELGEREVFDRTPGPRAQTERIEFARRAEKAFESLSDDERETIMLHLYAELTFRDIAALRDRPIGTVTSWYRRGLAHMRQLLEE